VFSSCLSVRYVLYALSLSAIERGDRQAAEQTLPLVYDELRMLASQRIEETWRAKQPAHGPLSEFMISPSSAAI
jgi:hypothetical protein